MYELRKYYSDISFSLARHPDLEYVLEKLLCTLGYVATDDFGDTYDIVFNENEATDNDTTSPSTLIQNGAADQHGAYTRKVVTIFKLSFGGRVEDFTAFRGAHESLHVNLCCLEDPSRDLELVECPDGTWLLKPMNDAGHSPGRSVRPTPPAEVMSWDSWLSAILRLIREHEKDKQVGAITFFQLEDEWCDTEMVPGWNFKERVPRLVLAFGPLRAPNIQKALDKSEFWPWREFWRLRDSADGI